MALTYLDRVGDGRVWPTRAVAGACRIPQELLGRILHALSRGGLVESVQGVKGGFRLNRRLESITLRDVIEIVDGPMRLTCCESDEGRCSRLYVCSIRGPVQRMQRDLMRYMKKIPLSAFRDGRQRRLLSRTKKLGRRT